MSARSPIVGHERQRGELLRDLETGNVAHAYLFAGPPHVGKFAVARWFATELLTRGLSVPDREREEERIARLLHPDFLVLDQLWIEERCEDWARIAQSSNVPQEHRAKAGAKTDRIGIDDVRMLQDRLYETGDGRYRCCLIRKIERMEDPPANAFLKILEEPPEGRVFLLTTESLGSLLPTVISRTRVIWFDHVPEKQMQSLLDGLDAEERRFMLHVARGAPGWIMRLRGDPDALRRERLLHAQAASFWRTQGLHERLKILSAVDESPDDVDTFLLHLALTLRESGKGLLPRERALRKLLRGLETNVQKPLLFEQFALAAG